MDDGTKTGMKVLAGCFMALLLFFIIGCVLSSAEKKGKLNRARALDGVTIKLATPADVLDNSVKKVYIDSIPYKVENK